jgi:glucosylceramidase
MTLLASLRRLVHAVTILSLFPAGIHAQHDLRVWMTTPDRTSLLKEQPKLHWKRMSTEPAGDAIVIDDSKASQTMDGFGHAVTGGSAQLIMNMSAAARHALLQELFGHGANDIDTSYIRISVGSSDMNDHVYTYDDMPAGETDPELKHFSLSEEERSVIPVLHEILTIQPHIKILASPWTAPAWMKDNDDVKGGSLKKEYYATYARYWVLYLQGMQSRGIVIDALTPQNEPENPKNTPSMLMTAEEQAEFIGKYLGPALASAGLKTKIIVFDHNCDHPIYPETILRDPKAAPYVDGSGFHLYLGDISALTEVHETFPQKNIYFTEQMVIPRRNSSELHVAEPVARIEIAAPQNWSRNVLLWNLAADPQNGPHTSSGGCPICSGAITVDGDKVTRLDAYYVSAHSSKFVPPGSVRIASGGANASLPHVAYRTPQGKHVLVVSNTADEQRTVDIRFDGEEASATLPAGAVASYVW